MLVRTYLKKHPEIEEFWIQAKGRRSEPDVFCLLRVNNFDDMNRYGDCRIREVEPAPEEGELVTLHIYG